MAASTSIKGKTRERPPPLPISSLFSQKLPPSSFKKMNESLEMLKDLGIAEAKSDGGDVVVEADNTIFQVESKTSEELITACDVAVETMKRVYWDPEKKSTYFHVVPRKSNVIYSSKLDRIVLQNKKAKIRVTALWYFRTTFVLDLIKSLCERKKECLLRSVYYRGRIFYQGHKLFDSQDESNEVINDVCCMLGSNRRSLKFKGADTGMVCGLLKFQISGKLVDCKSKDGESIPRDTEIDKVEKMETDACFILLIEKECVFGELADDEFYKRFPCILITGKGQPDVASKRFLRKLALATKLPVLALVDGDIYGIAIVCTYVLGSRAMSYDSKQLVTPNIKWLGIRPSDIEKYKIPNEALLNMKTRDTNYAYKKMQQLETANRRLWADEIRTMIKKDASVGIEALDSVGIGFLTDVFLPNKIIEQDWI